MVAEKPSLARSLADLLSRKQCRRRKSSCGACDVYEYEGRFPPIRSQATFKMTSVCGHVMSLDFLPKYNKWDQVDPVGTASRESPYICGHRTVIDNQLLSMVQYTSYAQHQIWLSFFTRWICMMQKR